MGADAKRLATLFKALADENRIKILALVREGELECACGDRGCDEARCMADLVEMLDISQATVSHHVKELVNAGLIETHRKGRWVHCQVGREGVAQVGRFIEGLISKHDRCKKQCTEEAHCDE